MPTDIWNISDTKLLIVVFGVLILALIFKGSVKTKSFEIKSGETEKPEFQVNLDTLVERFAELEKEFQVFKDSFREHLDVHIQSDIENRVLLDSMNKKLEITNTEMHRVGSNISELVAFLKSRASEKVNAA